MPKRIVAVLGDYWHPAELSKEALETALRPLTESGEAEVSYVSVNELEQALTGADRPDAVVMFKEDKINPMDEQVERWMTKEAADAAVRYVQDGGGWLAWHSGLASYDGSEAAAGYIDMLRGYFVHHPNDNQIVRYEPVGADGWIQGFESFEVIDEQYFVECKEAETTVLLRSHTGADGSSVAAWAHEFGQGRVCCVTPAHRREGLLHPSMSDLLLRAVKWCCKEE